MRKCPECKHDYSSEGYIYCPMCGELLANSPITPEPATEFFHTGNKESDIIALLDMAYDLVEIWDVSESPYNQRLKKCWMKRSRELGAVPSW